MPDILKIKSKKGLSEVVAVVLLILMSIIAIGIVWTGLLPLFSLSPEFSCTQAQIEQSLIINNACFNSQTNDVELILSRSISGVIEIDTLEFTITSDSPEGNLNYHCGEGADCDQATVLKKGETRTYFFNIPDRNTNEAIISINNGCALVSEEIQSSC